MNPAMVNPAMVNWKRAGIFVVLAAALNVAASDVCLAKDDKEAAAAQTHQPMTVPMGDPATANLLIALLYDKSCYTACQKVRPIIKELVGTYNGRVAYVELDATSVKEAEKLAKLCGVVSFLADSTDFVPLVGIFNAKRKLLKEIQGPKAKEVYAAAIDKYLAAK